MTLVSDELKRSRIKIYICFSNNTSLRKGQNPLYKQGILKSN